MPARRLWRDLTDTTKARYRRQGVTPSAYNAWQRKTPAQRAAIREAYPDRSGPSAIAERGRQLRERLSALRNRAFENMRNVLTPEAEGLKHHPNDEKIRERVRAMNRSEALLASTADLDLIRMLASEQTGWRKVGDTMVNPFWYG